jgi:drug/metabolite transporter (DMT)-like permease
MTIFWNAVRVGIAAITVVAVAELSKRYPRHGALLLSLPIISILAILFSWFQHRDLPAITNLSRETLILVPLGLPFFLPLAFATRLGLSFWSAFAAGIVLASVSISSWLFFGPKG